MPIKALIIDDEPAAIDVISELCRQLTDDIAIAGTASSGIDAVRIIMEKAPDLVFLDVDMPQMNGIQVLEKLPSANFELVFTTGSSSYAMKAIKLDAVDYLLKPIDPADFLLAMAKVRKRLSLRARPEPQSQSQRLQLNTLHGMIYVKEDDIVNITAMGSYSNIHTISSEKITISKSLGQLEENLSKDVFFRCHNSHIVNLAYITRFSTKDGYSVTMQDGTVVEVSRRSKDRLLQLLAERSK